LFVIVSGLFCYKKEIFNKTQIDGFELLLLKIILPSYLSTAAYKSNLSASPKMKHDTLGSVDILKN